MTEGTLRRLPAAVGIALMIAAGTPAFAGSAYPEIADTSHAEAGVAAKLDAYFTAKTQHSVDRTMSYFSPNLLTYTDATFGWPLDGFSSVKAIFDKYMPGWPPTGLSYPVRVLGGPDSALVEFIDTKELFGGELRIFGAVDFTEGKIIRWVDYWDGDTYPLDGYRQLRTTDDKFPTDYKEAAAGEHATAKIRSIANSLDDALSTDDVKKAADLFTYEAVFEDRTARIKIVGKAAIERFLTRALDKAPYGIGSRRRHIVGGDEGGGFEWIGRSNGALSGITSIELNADGKITNLSEMYDGRMVPADALRALVLTSLE
jgi:hypothetical protein